MAIPVFLENFWWCYNTCKVHREALPDLLKKMLILVSGVQEQRKPVCECAREGLSTAANPLGDWSPASASVA